MHMHTLQISNQVTMLRSLQQHSNVEQINYLVQTGETVNYY